MIQQMVIKRFLEWIGLKEKLHAAGHSPPHLSEGEIWWASIGENLGSEISGKSAIFSRPVIIYKKLSHRLYFSIPTTSQPKTGSWFIAFKQQGKTMNACLHQAKVIDYRRLYSKLGTLDEEDFERIKNGFNNLYQQKNSPPLLAGSRENPESDSILDDIIQQNKQKNGPFAE